MKNSCQDRLQYVFCACMILLSLVWFVNFYLLFEKRACVGGLLFCVTGLLHVSSWV